MQSTDIKTKIVIIAVIIIAVVTIGLYIFKQSKEESYIYTESFENGYEETSYGNMEEEQEITVHVAGEVKYPGVVVLKVNARIVDAIESAGGETEEADLNKLNLAYILNDGDKIYVPNKNEQNVDPSMTTVEEGTESRKQIININTATLNELIELPGIGEATANKIIEYRKENGRFENIEELKNVPGIGNAKFENLKDQIKVK